VTQRNAMFAHPSHPRWLRSDRARLHCRCFRCRSTRALTTPGVAATLGCWWRWGWWGPWSSVAAGAASCSAVARPLWCRCPSRFREPALYTGYSWGGRLWSPRELTDTADAKDRIESFWWLQLFILKLLQRRRRHTWVTMGYWFISTDPRLPPSTPPGGVDVELDRTAVP